MRTEQLEALMSDSANAEISMPQDIPPRWANSLMKWALTTPGLQSMVGQGVALLTFTGRRTGQIYTIPVSYHRENDTVTVITKRARKWWHNFETPIEVELRLAGETFAGKAEVEAGDAEVLEFMTDFLEKRPIDAKAYGLKQDEITKEKVASILPHIVLIVIEITPIAA